MSTYTKTESTVVPNQRSNRYLVYDYAATEQGPYVSTTGATKTNVRTHTGTHGPRRRRQMAKQGLNIATGFVASETKYSGGFGSHSVAFSEYRFINGKNTLYPCYSFTSGKLVYVNAPTLGTISADTISEAKAKLLKSASRRLKAFKAFTFTGELGEALRMIRSPGKSLRRELLWYIRNSARRNRRIRDRSARRRAIADSYLEWTFGVQPLTNDIGSAMEAFHRSSAQYESSYARVSGTATEILSTQSAPDAYESAETCLRRKWGVINTFTNSMRYYGAVKSYCPEPKAVARNLYGVSWGDVALTGWELVPWSFVADYFTNIGDILDSWTIRDSDWGWLCSVARRTAKATTTSPIDRAYSETVSDAPRFVASAGLRSSLSCSPAHVFVRSVNRSTPFEPPSTIALRFEAPGLSSRKWLNLAALGAAHKRAMKHVSS